MTCAYRRCAVSLELQSCSDGELAALTLGGRQAAFAEIMHRHQSAIFRLVRGLVGNAEEALDLTQDCFVSAFSHLRKYDRSEEHTSELQSLMRTSYADFCLKKKTFNTTIDVQRTYTTPNTSTTNIHLLLT